MEGVWLDSNGTLVAYISDLTGHGLYENGVVTLPNNHGNYSLRDAARDYNDDEIQGWRFVVGMQKYLVIND